MTRIHIKNLNNKELDLSGCGTSLLHCLLAQGLDWMHECGGKGRCTSCKVKVLSGMDNFTPVSPAETRYREQHLLRIDERLTCQVRLRGDAVVQVPDEGKLPHQVYSDDQQES